MAANSTFVPAKDVVLVVAGVTQLAQDCTLTLDIGTWDATTTGSAGWNEEGTDIKSAAISGTTIVDSTNLKTFTVGTVGTCSYTVTGEQATSGSGRITKIGKKGGARGGMMVSFDFKFTGPVTTV